MKHDLIVFAEDWGQLPSSTQHLIKRLTPNRKIIWVNSIGLRKPQFSLHDITRIYNKLTQPKTVSASSTSTASFQTITLKTIPAPKTKFARWIAKKLICYQLAPILKQAQLHQPVLWASLPTVADLCGALGEYGVIYYCGDDFNALTGVDHATVIQHETKLVAKADLVLAASMALYNKFPQHKTHYLPHGVDFQLFNHSAARAHDLPENNRPTAGFYGSLSHWLDYDLLNNIIANNPDWNFVFIGKKIFNKSPFLNHSNLYLLGEKPHTMLPQYSQHWQVSLLPFIDNAQIRSCNPLKLLEYLATGTPIISTPFTAVLPYKSVVNIAQNATEFSMSLQAIKTAWYNTQTADTIKKNKRLQQIALSKQQTWDIKAQQLEQWLDLL
ncbi:glycosyl transferase [Photobacterium aquimaris]|uniref:Glycosyltransferase family 1 protein n=1 Tax=Photobacterium aquimaris TaxID=512643 RepID=A0A2T3ITC5_9GAMM|nr:glycosyltransferase family 1 protein [Photobacterium aquimaris]OBU18374.1 glycosyl transferase [Photobacterium aquimaris]OBU20797.1 glycosyl transferase [Photobacterium aquimaris]PSU31613.1 glycosyltransferase family 1 protein [Photobacterium aquimaris]PSW03297.1 glycosyltransferase family 1 protein [Photobacterium aquimaris]